MLLLLRAPCIKAEKLGIGDAGNRWYSESFTTKKNVYLWSFWAIVDQHILQRCKLLHLLKTCTCLHDALVVGLSLNVDTLNFISWAESLTSHSSKRVCNWLPSHVCGTSKIILEELSFGLLDKYYAQKEPLRFCSECSTTSSISPAAKIHYVLVSWSTLC